MPALHTPDFEQLYFARLQPFVHAYSAIDVIMPDSLT